MCRDHAQEPERTIWTEVFELREACDLFLEFPAPDSEAENTDAQDDERVILEFVPSTSDEPSPLEPRQLEFDKLDEARGLLDPLLASGYDPGVVRISRRERSSTRRRHLAVRTLRVLSIRRSQGERP